MGDSRSNNADISTFALRLGISLSMTKLISGNWLWLLLVLLFSLCVLAVQPAKPVWVDECYTYYGVSHDSFDEFWRSMCCGVNFAPPPLLFSELVASTSPPILNRNPTDGKSGYDLCGSNLNLCCMQKALGDHALSYRLLYDFFTIRIALYASV